MKMKAFLFVIFAIAAAPVLQAQDPVGATAAFTRTSDGIKCHGAMIAASGYRVLATAAHCLGNLYNGGIRLIDGSSSIDVIVHDDVSSRGRASNDNDFALVIFSQNSSQTTARIDRTRKSAGSSVYVVAERSGRLHSMTETVKGYTSNSTRTAGSPGPPD